MNVFSATFDAIGVANQVTVTDERVLEDAVAVARAEVAALDEACSRFREDSELARVNRTGEGVVSPLLLDAVEAALMSAETTDGLVDPTVGGAMQALGYDRDFDVIVRGLTPTFELRPASGWRTVAVDRSSSRIRLRRGGELDLGATAKAFASDRIAHTIYAATRSSVLVSLGGDIACAGLSPDGGWPILVTDDSRAHDGVGQVVSIRDGGLATSSITVRRWRSGNVEMHHIIDPRTGAPARGVWRTVSVAADTCLAANTAATAAIVMGATAPAWLEERGLAARLVRVDGDVVAVGGWPEQVAS
jgi:thiamine biosynthesis lipoprotein